MVLDGKLVECGAVRYTPAGIPILEGVLQHQSTVLELAKPRQVLCEIRWLLAGEQALSMQTHALGLSVRMNGFLAKKSLNSKTLVLHVQSLQILDPR
ncbi:primosomal replication protein N [Parvibium lacunae]|uniref:Primosomal replication protein N n=1 Tax=Parvibium lacunae TaxID=1888893 RepID=A0A368L8G2_9BURK|nr:primosomal replication protein N [Parvibium lacunae]